VGQGQTRTEALRHVQNAMASHLARREGVTVEAPLASAQATANPSLAHFGGFKEDPTFDDFWAEIEAYRAEVETEEREA